MLQMYKLQMSELQLPARIGVTSLRYSYASYTDEPILRELQPGQLQFWELNVYKLQLCMLQISEVTACVCVCVCVCHSPIIKRPKTFDDTTLAVNQHVD